VSLSGHLTRRDSRLASLGVAWCRSALALGLALSRGGRSTADRRAKTVDNARRVAWSARPGWPLCWSAQPRRSGRSVRRCRRDLPNGRRGRAEYLCV